MHFKSPIYLSNGALISVGEANACLKALCSHFISQKYQGLVALAFHPNFAYFPYIVPAITACKQCSIPFYTMNILSEESLSQFPITAILGDSRSLLYIPKNISIVKKKIIFEKNIFLYQIHCSNPILLQSFNQLNKSEPILYAITTSGTTSTKKVVYASHSSVDSNVKDFINCFDSVSAVVVSSPPIFDPFYVDILFSVAKGLPIFLSTSNVRIRSKVYVKYIMDITSSHILLQMTPTLYNSISFDLLKDTSKKITFVLGGEQFPSLSSIPPHSVYYNVFGVTEMSCWQSMVKIESILDIPILHVGSNLISNTDVYLVDDKSDRVVGDKIEGRIVVSSQIRRCFRGESCVIYDAFETGDIGYYAKGYLYFNGRNHDSNIVKINGKRTNLLEMERRLKFILPSTLFHLDFYENALTLYCVNELENVVSSKILTMADFSSFIMPSKIIKVGKIPFNANGKVNKDQLRPSFHTKRKEAKNNILKEDVEDLWNKYTGILPKDTNNFILDGGDSHCSLAFLEELGVDPDIFIEIVLNQSFSDLVTALKGPIIMMVPSKRQMNVLEHKSKIVETQPSYRRRGFSTALSNVSSIKSINLAWKIDLEKCIDASVLVVDDCLAYVGSHSGIFLSCCVARGVVKWSIKLPDRIESSAIASSRFVIVGCYNHALYSIEKQSGAIAWSYSTSGMIKSSPIIIDELVIFGSYDYFVYSLHRDTGTLCWKTNFVNSCILTSPAVTDGYGYVASLNGFALKLNTFSGEETWRVKLGTPIFSSGVTLRIGTTELFIFGGANGILYGINCDSSKIMWTFSAENSIFSSIALQGNTIAFGSHDHHLYIGYICETKFDLTAKIDLGHPIYSTPYFFGPQKLVGISIDGRFVVVESKEVSLDVMLPVNGQIFSSPIIFDKRLVFGCRDNHLYGFDI
ncbi:beta-alanine-activating enzyme [Lepeophtheirus salmonis]|uniref:beta-alanine-activating enzyme n=1 Tax=Lepeophtheirus salmonis TaxID=72036 RepID=UPI001AE347B2|nr:beta-alanine-activating enzyme-like [Lepeophtheirus salmonis]